MKKKKPKVLKKKKQPVSKKKKKKPQKPSRKKEVKRVAKKATKKKSLKKGVSKKTSKKKEAIKKTRSVKKAKAIPKKKSTPKKKIASSKKKETDKKSTLKKSEREKLNFLRKEMKLLIEKEKSEKMTLKNAEGRHYCQIEDCDLPASVGDYCRLHYMAKWHYIINRKKILENKVIDKTILKLVNKHSENILSYLIKDFSLDKNFSNAVKNIIDVEIDNYEEDVFLET